MEHKADSIQFKILSQFRYYLLFLTNIEIFRESRLREIFKIIKVVFKVRNIERRRRVLEWN
jgi:hypothetical protein